MALSGQINTNDIQTRYYYLSWSATQSIASNTSTISWSVGCTGGTSGWYMERDLVVTLAGRTLVNKKNEVKRYAGVIASGSFDITHNASGQLNISGEMHVSCYLYTINLHGNGSWSLDNIPRQANLTSASNFNDTQNPTIYYNNPAGNAVDSIETCISWTGGADISYRAVSKTGSSYTYNFTEAERNILRNSCTTSNSKTVTFYIKTVIGGNTFYSTVDKTLYIVNANPTISASVVDTGSVSVTLTGNKNKMIKGYNVIKATASATAYKGATIKSYTIRNGTNYQNSSSATFSYTDTNVFEFTVTDSRGNTSSKTITMPMINYTKLTVNMDVPPPTTGGDLTISVAGNYFNGSFGAVANTLSVKYRKKSGYDYQFGAWTDVPFNISGNKYTGSVTLKGLDYKTRYTFQVAVFDKINSNGLLSPEKTVQTTPIFDWGASDFNINVLLNTESGILTRHLFLEDIEKIKGTKFFCIARQMSCGGITIPADSFAVLITNGYTGALFALGSDGRLYTVYKQGNSWVNGRVR